MKLRCAWLGGAEIQRFGLLFADVADDLAVLAEEHAAVGVEHDALGLERARRHPVVAVGDHVGVVHVDVVLAVEERVHPHPIEEELPHPLFFLADRRAGAARSALPSIGSVKRTMLKTMSSFSFLAHARMFSASFRFMWKMVVEIPKLKRRVFCRACIARIVWSPSRTRASPAAPGCACRRRRRSTRGC